MDPSQALQRRVLINLMEERMSARRRSNYAPILMLSDEPGHRNEQGVKTFPALPVDCLLS
jgi:hypothetical protein